MKDTDGRSIGDEKWGKKLLFFLSDDTPVYKNDILWHPDTERYGWYLEAAFVSHNTHVTMVCDNGAVPTVKISELKRRPPKIKWCSKCGQQLPPK